MRCARTEKKTVTPRRSAGDMSGVAVSASNVVFQRLGSVSGRIPRPSRQAQAQCRVRRLRYGRPGGETSAFRKPRLDGPHQHSGDVGAERRIDLANAGRGW